MLYKTIRGLEILFLGALIFVAIEAGILIRRAQTALPGMLTDYARLAQDASGVTAQLRKTLKQTQDDSQATVKNVQQSTATLNTDLTVLGQLEMQIGDTLTWTRQSANGLVIQASETLTHANVAAERLTPILDDIRLSTDKLPAVVDNFRIASEDIDAMGTQGVGILDDAHTETGLVVGQTRNAFKPKNKFLAVLQILGGGAVSAAEGYYYFTH